MDEEISNTVNLDLNLGPVPEVSLEPVMNSSAWVNGQSNGESESLRRFWALHGHIDVRSVPAETHSPLIELSQLIIPPALPAGDGERVGEKCENGNKVMEEENVKEEKRVVEKSVGSEGSFFDCYVCLDLSKDPVVTNCGHLFCWSCLYRWLQVSEAKECPVCKGEVSVKTLTPIYGRGEKNKKQSPEGSDANKKIPSRPQARRVESLRTTLERSGYVGRQRESMTGERSERAFFRLMTSRGVRAERNLSGGAASVAPLGDARQTNLGSSINSLEYQRESRQLRAPPQGTLIQRQMMQAARPLRMSFSPVLSPAERLEDAYLMTHAFDEQLNAPGVGAEDRDSFSSIMGVMNSESQVDTAAEIDSMVTVSTSSSVRRPHENGSRVSDVDSADSRPLRRRRLA
ncbi:RING-type domain-containing protein [Hirschfeldia incana]|nr:RING-type domain-containing protein [Hirschfeldia incana]